MDVVGWYPRLMPQTQQKGVALLDVYHEEQLLGMLVVSRETNSMGRNYKVLRSHVELFKMIEDTRSEERRFHEIIAPHHSQKLRFDLDISECTDPGDNLAAFGEMLKDRVITATLRLLREMGETPDIERDLSIYTSHRCDKRSYHIIFHKYCHTCSEDSRYFYNLVLSMLEPGIPYQKYIDHGIYNRYASLRMLWCHKLSEPLRPKRWLANFSYLGTKYSTTLPLVSKSERHRNLQILSLSLVTFTSCCKFLPSYQQEVAKSIPEIEIAPQQLQDVGKILQGFDPALEVTGCRGGLLLLKRNAPSWCPICNREHHAENPYAWISNEQVYYNCRRAPRDFKLLLGTITSPETSPSPVENDKCEEVKLTAEVTTAAAGESVIREMEYNQYKKYKKAVTLEDEVETPEPQLENPSESGSTNATAVQQKYSRIPISKTTERRRREIAKERGAEKLGTNVATLQNLKFQIAAHEVRSKCTANMEK